MPMATNAYPAAQEVPNARALIENLAVARRAVEEARDAMDAARAAGTQAETRLQEASIAERAASDAIRKAAGYRDPFLRP